MNTSALFYSSIWGGGGGVISASAVPQRGPEVWDANEVEGIGKADTIGR